MSDYKKLQGKRLLILGGAAQCCKVVEAAKEIGVFTIVTDINQNGKALKMADIALPFSVMDSNAIIKWCEENPVDGVINYCIDYAQISHQLICEHFGFPCYGNREQYHIMTDKNAFKAFCRQNDVGVVPEYLVEETDKMVFPVLVKPAESSGSRGIQVCYNKEEMLKAVEKASVESKNGKTVIEKYMEGVPDFSVTFVIIDGEPYLIRTMDRYLGSRKENLGRQCICGRCPSKYTDRYLELADNRVKQMLRSLRLTNAAVFMQGFVDGDDFMFYDPAIRFTGSEYESILYAATGVDIVKPFISYALGNGMTDLKDKLDGVFRLNDKCGLHLLVDALPGRISKINGAESIEKLPFILKVQQKHNVGYVVPDSGDVKQRIFEITALLDDINEDIIKSVEHVDRMIEILDEKGQSMRAGFIDPQVIT